MPGERVLVSGAGVAGCVLAYWLAKYDYQVVVVERSREDQKQGQGLEIEQPALQVVKAMGVMGQLKEKQTSELGFVLLDKHNRSYGHFGMGEMSPTGELELMRGDMTEVFYRAADQSPNVSFRFETSIQSLRQTQTKVIVDLETRSGKGTGRVAAAAAAASTLRTEEFDFVVGADGIKSRTRQLVMGSPEQLDCFKPVGAFSTYFSIPKQPQDWPDSRACHFPGRRFAWIRPTTKDADVSSVYLIHISDNNPALSQANASGDRQKQKEAVAELFAGLGWETDRFIDGMMKTDNFYSDELVQVKLDRWSQDRFALVGDAAWAPTPFTGQGNQLAIIGAWVLAQEMSRNRTPAAFAAYEKRLRAYVESSQKIPARGYAPRLLCPQTESGIWLLRMMLWFLSIAVGLWDKFKPSSSSSSDKQPEWDFDLEISKDDLDIVRTAAA